MRNAAAWALWLLNDYRAVDPLIQALQDENPEVRYRAAEALGELGSSRAIEALKSALSDEDAGVQEAPERRW